MEREFSPASGDNASLQRMRSFADSDGHIVSSGATSDHDSHYNDSIGSVGHRRKVVIDGIFNRCFFVRTVARISFVGSRSESVVQICAIVNELHLLQLQ